jgi:hypothetical protein
MQTDNPGLIEEGKPVSPAPEQNQTPTTSSETPPTPAGTVTDQPAAAAATQRQIELRVGPPKRNGVRVVDCTIDGVRHRDQFNTDVAAKREKFIAEIARSANISPSELQHLDAEIISKSDEAVTTGSEQNSPLDAAEKSSAKLLAETDDAVVEAAMQFLSNPHLIDELHDDFQTIGIVGEQHLACTTYFVATSRKLPKPLAAIVQAATSSGKTFVSNAVIGLMPPEGVLQATAISSQALFYMPPGALKNKLVCVAERKHRSKKDSPAEANETLAIREMLSTGVLNKTVTAGGGTGTMMIRQEGPIAYLETTTAADVFDEDATRLLPLSTDETMEQTERIVTHLAKKAAGLAAAHPEIEFVKAKHQAAQRMLEPLPVVVPFAEHIRIPGQQLSIRRTYEHLLSCIMAVALLRQRQNKTDEQGRIVASIEDYRIAYPLMLPILRRVFGSVNEKSLALLRVIVEHCPQDTFTFADCRGWWAGPCPSTIRDRLNALVDAGFLEVVGRRVKGKTSHYKILIKDATDIGDTLGLITPDQLEAFLTQGEVNATTEPVGLITESPAAAECEVAASP